MHLVMARANFLAEHLQLLKKGHEAKKQEQDGIATCHAAGVPPPKSLNF